MWKKFIKKRLEKVIEIEGERLEPVHLQEIKKELNDEEDNEDNMEKTLKMILRKLMKK